MEYGVWKVTKKYLTTSTEFTWVSPPNKSYIFKVSSESCGIAACGIAACGPEKVPSLNTPWDDRPTSVKQLGGFKWEKASGLTTCPSQVR